MLCRTLLLDDEPHVLAALRRELLRKPDIGHDGLEIETFTSPGQALARAATADGYFDLAIVDFHMPEMDGVRFLAELRKLQPHTVRVLLTGDTNCEAALAAINTAGADCLVFKPWNEYGLKGRIALALHQRALEHTVHAGVPVPRTGPYQLMLVDDEVSILNALTRELRAGGAATEGMHPLFAISRHESAVTALEAASTACPDLVIADYAMPGLDGIIFLQRLRMVCPNAVRIMLSGRADLGLLADAVNLAGVYHFLRKPWAATELRAVIAQALVYRDILINNNAAANASPEI